MSANAPGLKFLVLCVTQYALCKLQRFARIMSLFRFWIMMKCHLHRFLLPRREISAYRIKISSPSCNPLA